MPGATEPRRPSARRALAALAWAWLALLPAAAGALELTAELRDRQGRPLADVVVVAVPGRAIAAPPPGEVTIDQVDKEFVSYVSAIRAGTRVRFPNHDNIRHHVYSFSPAKVFDLPLYAGNRADPVTFDKPGVVVIGCNIHDWMLGYLYVSDSPWFAVSDRDGLAHLHGLAPGSWQLRVWHPRATTAESDTRRQVELGGAAAPDLRWVLELGPDRRPPRVPMPGMDAYR